jgi:hypothetical protein
MKRKWKMMIMKNRNVKKMMRMKWNLKTLAQIIVRVTHKMRKVNDTKIDKSKSNEIKRN